MSTLLLLASAGLAVALAFVLWRSWSAEQQLRDAEQAQVAAVAERILQRAPSSRAAFDAVAADRRAVVSMAGDVEAHDVGWSSVQDSAVDRDFVVEDRLARATRAEFVGGDVAAAQREFDELLAAPLMQSLRMQVLVAAAWQAQRAGLGERVQKLCGELDELGASLRATDLARPAIANVVASRLRLLAARGEDEDEDKAPKWASELAPFLPPELFAGLPQRETWQAAQRTIVARRELLLSMQQAWTTTHAASGLVAADAHRLLWWLLREDGGHDVALLSPDEWCRAIEQAGHDGALPELPSPYTFAAAADTSTAFGGIPGLAGTADPSHTFVEPVWLRPALTGALLLVLSLVVALAVVTQLRAARREVAAVQAQAEFLTTITHELKTPLAAIRLLGEMLAEGRAKGREVDYYRMLVGESARLSMLIENVLDLGRLERGERAYELQPVDVAATVAATLELFAPVAAHDGKVIAGRNGVHDAIASIDRDAFVQALVSVLDNARKYSGAGSAIDVVTQRIDGHIVVDVRDHGAGVAADERERIFERFVRGREHAHGSTPGVGIGLYLARTIARRLGGELVCAAPDDGGPGALFRFTFPLENRP